MNEQQEGSGLVVLLMPRALDEPWDILSFSGSETPTSESGGGVSGAKVRRRATRFNVPSLARLRGRSSFQRETEAKMVHMSPGQTPEETAAVVLQALECAILETVH